VANAAAWGAERRWPGTARYDAPVVRAVVQRVSQASVSVDGAVVGAIAHGLLVLLGVGKDDTDADAAYLATKVAELRVFPDAEGLMNRSVLDTSGAVLAVSQFTLYGDARRGRRPGYSDAAPPELASSLYQAFIAALRGRGLTVAEGVFRAHMAVSLVNDGPVTILLDSHKQF
jgi:D-aminoacyl-tRNA deacylase